MLLWICSMIIIVFSSRYDIALSAQPYSCICPVNKAVFLFDVQLCVALYRLLKEIRPWISYHTIIFC